MKVLCIAAVFMAVAWAGPWPDDMAPPRFSVAPRSLDSLTELEDLIFDKNPAYDLDDILGEVSAFGLVSDLKAALLKVQEVLTKAKDIVTEFLTKAKDIVQ